MSEFNDFMEDLVGGALLAGSSWLVDFSESDVAGPIIALVVVGGVMTLLWVTRLARGEGTDRRRRHHRSRQ